MLCITISAGSSIDRYTSWSKFKRELEKTIVACRNSRTINGTINGNSCKEPRLETS